MRHRWVVAMLVAAGTASLAAAELQPRTVAAFNRYVRATESQRRTEPFLWVDRLPASKRSEAIASMRGGLLSIESRRTLEGDREIDPRTAAAQRKETGLVGTDGTAGALPRLLVPFVVGEYRCPRFDQPSIALAQQSHERPPCLG